MDDREFRAAMQSIGHGSRSFSILRTDAVDRPLAAAEQIADKLGEEIARGWLPAGAHLREQTLAERFRVSRGPIRDALRLLERDALIRVSPNRGATVVPYPLEEMRHLAALTLPITRLNVGGVAKRASDDSLQEMRAAQRRIARLLEDDDPVPFALAVAAISLAHARFSTGHPGEKIIQLLYRPSIRYTIAGLQQPGARPPAAEQWERHSDAFAQRDVETAVQAFIKMLRDIQLPVIPGAQP